MKKKISSKAQQLFNIPYFHGFNIYKFWLSKNIKLQKNLKFTHAMIIPDFSHPVFLLEYIIVDDFFIAVSNDLLTLKSEKGECYSTLVTI